MGILKTQYSIAKKKFCVLQQKVLSFGPNRKIKVRTNRMFGRSLLHAKQNWLLNEAVPGPVGNYDNNYPNLQSTYGFIVNLPKSLTTFGCGSIIFITESSFKRSLLSFSVAVDFRVLIATTVRHSSLPGMFST